MLTFDEAFKIVLDSADRLGTERVDLEQALGRILAEDVVADMDIPPFNKSAMDGYACRRRDIGGDLEVIETIPAGVTPEKTIGPGRCSKIMTGAVVPEGADCVIMVEHCEQTGEKTIRLAGNQTPDNICLKGEDVRKADTVLRAGCKIGPEHVAVLASHGCVKPLVAVRPKVGIIATGDELVGPFQKPTGAQIRNSNSYQLAAQARLAGTLSTNYGIAGDTQQAIDVAVKKALAENNVVLLSGGVSAGDYDIVKDTLEANRVKLIFDKVAVKPGGPSVFGVCDRAFCFALPGNPVSTFVIFEVLVKPFLYKMMGHDFKPRLTYGPLESTLRRKKTGRSVWLPVAVRPDGKVVKVDYHGSAHISALCGADGLVYIPAQVAEIKEGTTVAVRQI
ncbi:MAG: molybdopterin molybdotransferase MoeA [Planctomycetota bacterium]|jgi:molybdopterin molybdotransferase